MKLGKYTIRDRSEETQCDQCGYPLYVGDAAYMSADGYVFCTKSCGKEHAEQERYRTELHVREVQRKLQGG